MTAATCESQGCRVVHGIRVPSPSCAKSQRHDSALPWFAMCRGACHAPAHRSRSHVCARGTGLRGSRRSAALRPGRDHRHSRLAAAEGVPAPEEELPPHGAAVLDEAILKDAWTKAWVLLDIDAHGVVQRVKLLRSPGYGMESIAIKHAMKMRFDPAEDAAATRFRRNCCGRSNGRPTGGSSTSTSRQPPCPTPDFFVSGAFTVPCKDNAPMQLGSLHPTSRDCSPPPPPSRINEVAWVTK